MKTLIKITLILFIGLFLWYVQLVLPMLLFEDIMWKWMDNSFLFTFFYFLIGPSILFAKIIKIIEKRNSYI